MDMHILKFVLFVMLSVSSEASSPALMLTPLLKQNKIEEARKLASVKPSLFLNITSYSGFFNVDETHGSNMFFWYFPVSEKPAATPWIIWLQGGPGATSLVGLFDEIGPFEYDEVLKQREHAWNNKYSMVFIDNPVGAGFSFTNSDNGFVTNMTTCAEHLYNTITQFLVMFPELQNAPLYVAGESYAGHYVPALAMKFLQMSKDTDMDVHVKLKGLILGNPVLDREDTANYSSVFYSFGLIDYQGVLAAKPLQDKYIKAIHDRNAILAHELYDKLLDFLEEITMQENNYNALETANPFEQLLHFKHFINNDDVREALHVGSIEFTFSNYTVQKKLVPDFIVNVKSQMEELLDHYKVLIYCGQLDLIAPCVSARSRRSWNWRYRDNFLKAPRTPWWFNNTIVGYVKSGGGYTEALLRGTGHLAPMNKPAEVLKLVSFFIRGIDLPMPPNYRPLPQYNPPLIAEDPTSLTLTSSPGLTASIIINVLLLLVILSGIGYFVWWKRKNDIFVYNECNDTLSDSILALS